MINVLDNVYCDQVEHEKAEKFTTRFQYRSASLCLKEVVIISTSQHWNSPTESFIVNSVLYLIDVGSSIASEAIISLTTRALLSSYIISI